MVPSISFSGRECRHADKIFAFPARTEFSVTTAAEERDKTKSKTKSTSSGTATDKKEEKQSGSDELLPLWCASASKSADTSPKNDRLTQPEIDSVAQLVTDAE
jgi:hypothetical protein